MATITRRPITHYIHNAATNEYWPAYIIHETPNTTTAARTTGNGAHITFDPTTHKALTTTRNLTLHTAAEYDQHTRTRALDTMNRYGIHIDHPDTLTTDTLRAIHSALVNN